MESHPTHGDHRATRVATVSGRWVVVGLLLGTLGIAGVVAKVRTDNWTMRQAYRDRMIDAGYQLNSDGTLVKP